MDKKTAKAEQTEALNRITHYKSCFNSDAGKEVLRDLKEMYHYGKTSFNPCGNTAAWLEGQRSVILDILKVIETDESEIIGFYQSVIDVEDDGLSEFEKEI